MPGSDYDLIGSEYNSTRQADPFLVGRIIFFLQPSPGKRYLDIGCGTGNYTAALAAYGMNFIGVEPSSEMRKVAENRSNKITVLAGTAENIPAADKMFEGILATLTIHHWENLVLAFKELGRVLSDKGRIVLFTSTPDLMKGYWLNHYFPEMLHKSILQMPSLETIQKAAEMAGLIIIQKEKYFIKDDLKDSFLYVGKNKPEIYFDEKIRKGISSFASLANAAEVEHGLAQLKQDLENKKFEGIKNKYVNYTGDYLFVIIEKSP